MCLPTDLTVHTLLDMLVNRNQGRVTFCFGFEHTGAVVPIAVSLRNSPQTFSLLPIANLTHLKLGEVWNLKCFSAVF
jgi:hypothetical protein